MGNRVAITFGDVTKLSPYERALREVGLEPVRNPASMDGLDGLLITGGTDVDPARYGEERAPETQTPDTTRDTLELARLKEALAQNLPVLAICRGMQLFNVAHGGSLDQHIGEDHVQRSEDPSRIVHQNEIEPGTCLAAIFGTEPLAVNSRHHQAVKKIGEGLVVSARCGSVVEGLERPDKRFAVAVEWHPEDQISDPRQRRLFEEFARVVTGSARGSAH